MGVLVVAVGLFGGFGAALIGSREVRYLTRAGLEEIRLLKAARPLESLTRDPAVDDTTRALLQLVVEVRSYAEQLGLDAGKTYTTYTDVGRDTLLLVLSAAPKDCLCPHTWKYPIVGRVPYKGFFDPRMAQREATGLEARGYDIYLRPAGAFSTLGWFNDPLLSTALTRDSMELAATVFHEISHNTLFVKSAAAFNESFAQYAGYHAAEAFFYSRGDSTQARRAVARWRDEMVLGKYYTELADRLERFYATRPDPARLDSGRAEIGRWAREQLGGPVAAQLRTIRVGPLSDRPVNNARLVGVRLYRSRLEWFEAWHQRYNQRFRDAAAAMVKLMEGAEAEDAFRRLENTIREPADSALAPGIARATLGREASSQ